MQRIESMEIYKPSYGDCSNNGIPSRFDKIRIVENVTESDIQDLQENDCVMIEAVCCGKRRVRCIPAIPYLKKTWTMFGGCFVYSCNGLNPWHDEAIKLHDRIE